MALFKSPEDREAEQREKDAAEQARQSAEQARQTEREQAAFAASPVGRAQAAKQTGARFFELQLQVGTVTGQASFGSSGSRRSTESSADVLADVEDCGWRLEHASYFFMMTGETSSQRVMFSGDATAVSGMTVGVYIFRNADTPH